MASQLNTNTATLENILIRINDLPDTKAETLLTLNVSSNIDSGEITATNGIDIVTGTLVDGKATIVVPSDGMWTVNAISGERVAEADTGVLDATEAVELVFFEATVGCYVANRDAVEVTCTNGTKTYTSTGTGVFNFTVYERGVWTVSAMINGTRWTYSPDVQTVGGIYIDAFGSDASLILNDNSWDTISQVSGSGLASNLWAVGDTKEVTINGVVGNTTFSNLSLWAFILGFDHNSEVEGANTIHFQIGKSAQTDGINLCLVDEKYNGLTSEAGYFTMNYTDDNSGGWESSKMRTMLLGNNHSPSYTLSGSLMAALPDDLLGVMKGCTKYSDNTGGGSDRVHYVTSTTDYLWLLAEYEVYGARSSANSAEQNYQKQYAYYANGNSKVFYKDNDTSSTAGWWLRSADVPYADPSSAPSFRCVNSYLGAMSSSYANRSMGVSPAFCV